MQGLFCGDVITVLFINPKFRDRQNILNGQFNIKVLKNAIQMLV
jgi:hypothetical protein